VRADMKKEKSVPCGGTLFSIGDPLGAGLRVVVVAAGKLPSQLPGNHEAGA
jgi:hypothetical protein